MKNTKTAIKKKMTGLVVSDKMDKTIVVKIDRLVEHSRYGKRVKISKKFKAHDEKNDAKIGDLVEIVESRPVSKDKNWSLLSVLKKAARDEEDGENE